MGLKTSPKTPKEALRWALDAAASSPHVDTVCLLARHGLGVLRVTFLGRVVGSEGSYLYSESPIIFPLIIWTSVKERSFSSSKCLTRSKEKKKITEFQVSSVCLLLAPALSPPPRSPSKVSVNGVTE